MSSYIGGGYRGSGPFAPTRSTSYLAQTSSTFGNSFVNSLALVTPIHTMEYQIDQWDSSFWHSDWYKYNSNHHDTHHRRHLNNFSCTTSIDLTGQYCVSTWQLSQALRSFREQFRYFDRGGKGCKEADLPFHQDPLGPRFLSGSFNYWQPCLDPHQGVSLKNGNQMISFSGFTCNDMNDFTGSHNY